MRLLPSSCLVCLFPCSKGELIISKYKRIGLHPFYFKQHFRRISLQYNCKRSGFNTISYYLNSKDEGV
jgi:hypothetical protein